MSTKAAVTADMNTRDRVTALERFADKVVVRNDIPLYLGSDGNVGMTYSSARDVLTIEPEGSGLESYGQGHTERIYLDSNFNKLPQLVGVASPPAADTYNTATMLAALQASQDFQVLGTNAVSADVTLNAGGGCTLSTHGAAADSTILLPHLTAGFSSWTKVTWGTDQSVRYEATIRTDLTAASVTNTVIWCGLKLTNTPTIATDDDQIYVLYDSSVDTNFRAIFSIANVDNNTTSSTVTIAQSTKYHIVIAIDSSRIGRVWINGTLICTTTALTTAVNFIPYIGVKHLTTAASSTLRVLRTSISRNAA